MPEVDGKEIPDPTPVAIPAGVGRPESLSDTIKRMVRIEMSQHASMQGNETFEEANDFDLDDEDNFLSPYEMTELQEEMITNAHTDPKDGADQPAAQSNVPDDRAGPPQHSGGTRNTTTNGKQEHSVRSGNQGVPGRDSRSETEDSE